MKDQFQYLAKENNEKLLMYGDWIDSTADMALARRWDNAQVIIYRGMAHRKEIDADALMLIICHELGHLYGGRPFKHSTISPEGQADYFATKSCITEALESWSEQNVSKRVNKAMLNVGAFLARNWRLPAPKFETPSTKVVSKTYMDHPRPQCRLDTFLAGLEHRDRPPCWYKEEILD